MADARMRLVGAPLMLLLLLALASTSPSLATENRGSSSKSRGIESIVTERIYNQFLPNRNAAICPSKNFYNYTAFVQAAKAFPKFGTTGSLATRKREIAAFFGQTSHETGGGWPEAPGGRYSWGYCYIEEINQSNNYCDAASKDWPCAPGQQYFGRGPIQLSWNFNYGPAGRALGFDGLGNPGALAKDPVLAFKAALWFWMTPAGAKASAHHVATGKYRPNATDRRAKRFSGYGLITNIINGGLECGPARNPDGKPNASQVSRIGYYRRYAKILGVGAGSNLSCTFQNSFA